MYNYEKKNTEISKLNEKDIETESNLKEVTKKLEHSQKQIEAQIKQLQEKDTHIKEINEQKEQLENTQLRSNEQVKLLNETIQNQTSALEQFKIDLEKTRQKITQVENIKNAEIEVLTKQMEVKEKEIKSAYAAASEEEKSKLFEDKIQQLQDTLNTKTIEYKDIFQQLEKNSKELDEANYQLENLRTELQSNKKTY